MKYLSILGILLALPFQISSQITFTNSSKYYEYDFHQKGEVCYYNEMAMDSTLSTYGLMKNILK